MEETLHLLIFPLPNFFDEFITTQVVSCPLFLPPQFLLDNDLSGNSCMVTAWIPQYRTSTHSVPEAGKKHLCFSYIIRHWFSWEVGNLTYLGVCRHIWESFSIFSINNQSTMWCNCCINFLAQKCKMVAMLDCICHTHEYFQTNTPSEYDRSVQPNWFMIADYKLIEIDKFNTRCTWNCVLKQGVARTPTMGRIRSPVDETRSCGHTDWQKSLNLVMLLALF